MGMKEIHVETLTWVLDFIVSVNLLRIRHPSSSLARMEAPKIGDSTEAFKVLPCP